MTHNTGDEHETSSDDDCIGCGGTGWKNGREENGDCPLCDGRGRWAGPMSADECTACNGTGWSNGVKSNGQCSACNGTGTTGHTSN